MAATATEKNVSVVMPVATQSTAYINAVDLTKSNLAVDGKCPTGNDDKRESYQMRRRPTKRTDIGASICHELTEMERCIDDDSDNDNSTKYSRTKADDKSVSTIKFTNSVEMASMSTTSDNRTRKPDSVGNTVYDANVEWDKSKSIKPLHRLFAQSHAIDTTERHRCDECVQIPIERIELVEDDDGMIIVHDVSFVQTSDSCFVLFFFFLCLCLLIAANGIGNCI